MNRHATRPSGDIRGMTIAPRTFAAIVGGLLLLVALIVLATPVSIADVEDSATTYKCGDAFKGLDRGDIESAEYANAGARVAAAELGLDEPLTYVDTAGLVQRCEDAISTKRTWGFPLGGLGLIVLAGAALVRPAGQSGTHATEQKGTP